MTRRCIAVVFVLALILLDAELALLSRIDMQQHSLAKTTKSTRQHLISNQQPSPKWLEFCAADLATNSSGSLVPFGSLRVGYALGDCVKMCCRCIMENETLVEESKNARLAKQQVLAQRYYKKACPLEHNSYVSGGNLDILEELLNSYEKTNNLSQPDPSAIVLHLRLGDVIEKTNLEPSKMLILGGDPAHSSDFKGSIKSVYEYMNNIQEAGVKKVIIIGGGYHGQYKKSRVYAGCLERALVHAGYEVSVNLDSGDADKDFYFMTHAKYFVASTGGFSALIGKLVNRFGGQVIGRTFDDTDTIVKEFEERWRNTGAFAG